MPHEPEHLRRQPRFVAKPTDAQLGYLAGILDGEGHFFAYFPKPRDLGITVQMNDKPVIEWLREHFHGRQWPCRTPAGTPSFRWALQRYADLAFLLPLVIPHLVAKRAQARALLCLVEHLLDPPTRHYTPPTHKLGSCEKGATERGRRHQLREEYRRRTAELSASVREARRIAA